MFYNERKIESYLSAPVKNLLKIASNNENHEKNISPDDNTNFYDNFNINEIMKELPSNSYKKKLTFFTFFFTYHF